MRFLGALVALAAVGAVVWGWLDDRPRQTPAQAIAFTRAALADAGLSVLDVAPDVAAGTVEVADGGAPFDVWVVNATVEGGTIELKVDQREAQAVFVRDQAAAGGPLLTEAQVAALDAFAEDPVFEERVKRNLTASAAGLLAAGVAVAAAVERPKTKRAKADAVAAPAKTSKRAEKKAAKASKRSASG